MMITAITLPLPPSVDSALRPVHRVHSRNFLSRVNDVIQYRDWLLQIDITSYKSRGLTYVVSHAFG